MTKSKFVLLFRFLYRQSERELLQDQRKTDGSRGFIQYGTVDREAHRKDIRRQERSIRVRPDIRLEVEFNPADISISVNNERLKFAAAYWVPSAGAEATGGKLFSGEGMYNCDLILITLPEGW